MVQTAEQSSYNQACLAAIAGETDAALTLLTHALEEEEITPAHVAQDPDLAFLRDDPRYQALLGRYQS